jgi:hypothetical protein
VCGMCVWCVVCGSWHVGVWAGEVDGQWLYVLVHVCAHVPVCLNTVGCI